MNDQPTPKRPSKDPGLIRNTQIGPGLSRRQGLALAGAAVVSGAIGLGFQHWRGQRQAAFDAETGGLWGQRFPRPEGGELVMADLLGRPLLLNFWATWCPPCLREMPEIERFRAANVARGVQVLGLAVDGPTPVREYLKKMKLGFAIGLAGFEGTDLSRRLGNAQGALPFTAWFGANGRLLQRKLGETSFDELQTWVQKL